MGRKKKPSRWAWFSTTRRKFLWGLLSSIAAFTTVLKNVRDLAAPAPTTPPAAQLPTPPAITHSTASMATHSRVFNETVHLSESLHIQVIRKP